MPDSRPFSISETSNNIHLSLFFYVYRFQSWEPVTNRWWDILRIPTCRSSKYRLYRLAFIWNVTSLTLGALPSQIGLSVMIFVFDPTWILGLFYSFFSSGFAPTVEWNRRSCCGMRTRIMVKRARRFHPFCHVMVCQAMLMLCLVIASTGDFTWRPFGLVLPICHWNFLLVTSSSLCSMYVLYS